MTREEQIKICEKCEHRKFDSKQGLICSLNNQPASFNNSYSYYKFDPKTEVEPTPFNQKFEVNGEKIRISEEDFEKLRLEQNYSLAVVSGVIAGIIGAILWGIITIKTGYQIGYVALGIGAGVGYTIRYFGKGIQKIFGITGAIIAFLSVVLGNLISIIGLIAIEFEVGFFEVFSVFDFSYFPDIMKETFSFMDVVFYLIAIVEGYTFSFRKTL